MTSEDPALFPEVVYAPGTGLGLHPEVSSPMGPALPWEAAQGFQGRGQGVAGGLRKRVRRPVCGVWPRGHSVPCPASGWVVRKPTVGCLEYLHENTPPHLFLDHAMVNLGSLSVFVYPP